jgi:hypothetical protein
VSQHRSEGAVALTWFASIMMMLIGVFGIIIGLGGIIKGDVYTVTPNYVFQFSVSTWGWIQLILGIVVLFAAFGLFSGAVWARTVGVLMASLNAIAQFAFLPHHPVWAICVLVLDVFVIWALTAHGRDVTKMGDA